MTEPVPTDSNRENISSDKIEEKNNSKKSLMYLAIGVFSIVLIGLLITGLSMTKGPDAVKPVEVGKVIIVPDRLDKGAPNEEFKIGKAVNDKTAPKYEEPEDISKYREVADDGTVYLKSPVVGRCAMSFEGGIKPPKNFMESCYYEKNGAVVYTSHAVIGPRTGALENISALKNGDPVTIDGVKYKVKSYNKYKTKELPEELFVKGNIGLVTCHLDDTVKKFEDYTHTDVTLLEKV